MTKCIYVNFGTVFCHGDFTSFEYQEFSTVIISNQTHFISKKYAKSRIDFDSEQMARIIYIFF